MESSLATLFPEWTSTKPVNCLQISTYNMVARVNNVFDWLISSYQTPMTQLNSHVAEMVVGLSPDKANQKLKMASTTWVLHWILKTFLSLYICQLQKNCWDYLLPNFNFFSIGQFCFLIGFAIFLLGMTDPIEMICCRSGHWIPLPSTFFKRFLAWDRHFKYLAVLNMFVNTQLFPNPG